MIRPITTRAIALGIACASAAWMATAAAQASPDMTFFVTSAGSGKGADFGGLAGADRHCQALAEAAGARGHTWRAYLSATAQDGQPAVNARERIGNGPWVNAKGVTVARDAAELHGSNHLDKSTALTEKGETLPGRGDPVNKHDVLTGSRPDGTAFPAGDDTTCGNWTKSGAEGAAWVGHLDRKGLTDDDVARSWNSSHLTRGGCSDAALRSTGGAGFLYCFAAR
jgi:hypothetical protein